MEEVERAAERELEEAVATALEAEPAERAALLERLEREDAAQSRRVRARLAALGELGMSVEAPNRAAHMPERFGRYRREQRIGAGGMGEVYRARDERSGAQVALKLVRPEHLWFDGARQRFRREVEASSQLAHAAIVRVLDVGEERGVPYLALEWVGGASLEEVLEHLRGRSPETLAPREFAAAVGAACAGRAGLEPPRDDAFLGATYVEVVTRVVARVAEALAHAHAAGVLHRDVKPSNVLVTPAGRVLLADFGLALPPGADRMTRTGQWLGSLPYAAPEQIEGSPRALDARADVYGLGATLYELLTLRTPFLGGPESDVRRRISTGELERPRRLNPALARELERVVLSALDLDPARRPSGAAELAEDLARALAGRAVRARSLPPWIALRRLTRRRPKFVLALAAGAMLVLGSGALALREKVLAARLTRLADAELVRGLRAEAETFWPADPAHLARMDAWLAEAHALLARRTEHQRAFDDLTARARPYADDERVRDQTPTRAELATLAHELARLADYVEGSAREARPAPLAPEEVRRRSAEVEALVERDPAALLATLGTRVAALRARMLADVLWRADAQQLDDFERVLARADTALGARATFHFEAPLDAWRHDALDRLLEDLDGLAALVGRVSEQRTNTADLERRMHGPLRASWEDACAAIAASPRYGGLRLTPLFGFAPLGMNATSGLFEFVFEPSGAAPEPDDQGGWRMDAGVGLVFVLLPGGHFFQGQNDDEGPPLVTARPRHELELAPFLVSRTELSVAQAERLGGFPEERTRPADRRVPLVIDWERARALLLAHGLELPTEAQWEYAARADTPSPAVLDGHANVYDQTRLAVLERQQTRQNGRVADFADGFAELAPIASLHANAFGLHDVLGNVAEWCLDAHVGRGYSTLQPRVGDGLRATVVAAQVRAVRGGSYSDGCDACQPAARAFEAPSKMSNTIGVRPVRRLGKE